MGTASSKNNPGYMLAEISHLKTISEDMIKRIEAIKYNNQHLLTPDIRELGVLREEKKELKGNVENCLIWKAKVVKRTLSKCTIGLMSRYLGIWKNFKDMKGVKEGVETAATLETEESEESLGEKPWLILYEYEKPAPIFKIFQEFERFMFWNLLRDIRNYGSKADSLAMQDYFSEYWAEKSIKESQIRHYHDLISWIRSAKSDFITYFFGNLIGVFSDWRISKTLASLITKIVNEFNKLLSASNQPPKIFDICKDGRIIGGMINVFEAFQLLLKCIKSKKIVFKILTNLQPDKCELTFVLHIIIKKLQEKKLLPEDLYDKINYYQKEKISCDELIEGINFYLSVKLDKQYSYLIYESFGSKTNCFITKLQFINLFVKSENSLLVSKTKLIESVVIMYDKYELKSSELAYSILCNFRSDFLSFDNFCQCLNTLCNSYDDFDLRYLFYKGLSIENFGGLLSKSTILELIKDFGIGCEKFSSFKNQVSFDNKLRQLIQHRLKCVNYSFNQNLYHHHDHIHQVIKVVENLEVPNLKS